MDLKSVTDKYTNKTLKKIVNVFQLDYLNNKKGTGLGDFLRGSVCFLQISKLLNLEFEIDLSNHPISKYLENSKNIKDINYNNITHFHEYNLDKERNYNYENKPININTNFLNATIELLNSVNCETYGFFSNAFPCFNYHTPAGKLLIRTKLEPNEFMKLYVDKSLNELGLSKKGYGVIHIRSGDNHLVNNETFENEFIVKIKQILNNIIVSNRRYLIISDSNVLKQCLKCYPNFYMIIREIEHLGGECMKNSESIGVMNTLSDFYLMSYSNSIIALSVYDHASGFSKYAGVLNDIPTLFINIKNYDIKNIKKYNIKKYNIKNIKYKIKNKIL
jgi:hypothetical protein